MCLKERERGERWRERKRELWLREGERREMEGRKEGVVAQRERIAENMFDSSIVCRSSLLWVPIPLLDTPPGHFWNLEMRYRDHNATLSTLLSPSAM